MKNSQQTKILNLLDDNRWHCSTEFYRMFIADPRKRLSELKDKGYNLQSEWCHDHSHEGSQKKWRLIDSTTRLGTITAWQGCCYSYFKFSSHDPHCPEVKKKEINTLF